MEKYPATQCLAIIRLRQFCRLRIILMTLI